MKMMGGYFGRLKTNEGYIGKYAATWDLRCARHQPWERTTKYDTCGILHSLVHGVNGGSC